MAKPLSFDPVTQTLLSSARWALQDIQCARLGANNGARFHASITPKIDLAQWGKEIKTAYQAFRAAASVPPEAAAYKRYMGSPSSMSYRWVEYQIGPECPEHSGHAAYVAAKAALIAALRGYRP